MVVKKKRVVKKKAVKKSSPKKKIIKRKVVKKSPVKKKVIKKRPVKKTAKQKLHDSKDLPKKVKLSGKMAQRFGEGIMVIPSPLEVDEVIRRVRKGRLITINKIRQKLSRKHKTDFTCPICTGLFSNISAHAAEEDRLEGKKNITPWWRVLKEGGELNPKHPDGELLQMKLLKKEGHKIIKKGIKFFVHNHKKKLLR